MKKLLGLVLLVAMLMTNFAFAENANKKFDLDVFTSQKRVEDPKYNQYSVSLDDMEARGFISLNKYISPSSYDYTYDKMELGGWLYVSYPDIYLAEYGTSRFFPLPRIWFEYYGKDMYVYDTVIFKIGNNTYSFYNSGVSSSLQLSNWSKKVTWESKTVCLCDTDYISFMDAWIENGAAPIKVRLKCANDTIDFNLEEGTQADTLLLFKNFKDAGGYALLPNLQ